MKKLILAVFLIVSTVSLKAQLLPGYYPGDSGTVKGSGFVYKYSQSTGFITLYNADNRLTGVEWALKDGSQIPDDFQMGYIPQFEKDGWTRQKAFSIVQNAINSLPSVDRARLKGESLMVDIKIDTSTGKVIEVEFDFLDDGPFLYVPPAIFRKIETDLKSQIWFTLTPEGRKLNYGGRNWLQKIKYVTDPTLPEVPTYPSEPTDPVDPPKGPIKKPAGPGETNPGNPIVVTSTPTKSK